MILRKETNADVEAITEVTIAAFKNHPITEKVPQGTIVFHKGFLANG